MQAEHPPRHLACDVDKCKSSRIDMSAGKEKKREEKQLVKRNLRSSLSKCHVAAIHSAPGAPGGCRDGGSHLPSSYHSSRQLSGTPAANPQTSTGVQSATDADARKCNH